MGPEVQNSFKEVARGAQYANEPGGIRDLGNMCLQIKYVSFFLENVIFSAQGAPRKSWGT